CLVVAVVDLAGGHDLVMRMAIEGGQCRVELLGHLRVHVFADDCEASLSQIGGDHESPRTCLLTSKLRYSGVPGQGPRPQLRFVAARASIRISIWQTTARGA